MSALTRPRWRRATMLAAALAATLSSAMLSSAAQDIPPDNPQTAANQQRPATASAQPEARVSQEAKQLATVPGLNKLDPADRNLTFLPELLSTDGVPSLATLKNGQAQLMSEAGSMHTQPLLLDRAVAIIAGDVILSSDVREQQHFAVFEPYSVPGGEFTPLQAMQQIVNRTLLLQQMNEQQLVPPPSDAAVDEQIADLRKHIPACTGRQCESDEGWRRFLAKQGFSEAAFHSRWQERMQILSFIEVRFRNGIRISKPEIESYYKQKLVPEFEARKMKPPSLASVSDRIDEVLLQQHVNVLLNDYLRTLKDAGSVQILDPAYSELGKSASATPGSDSALPGSGNGGDQ